MFKSTEETHNWEMWHRQFGYIGYSRLQKFVNLKMVDGLSVDIGFAVILDWQNQIAKYAYRKSKNMHTGKAISQTIRWNFG